MSLANVLPVLWELVNSPLGISLLAGAFVWILNALYGRKPEWQKYEGSIIAAIRAAEKAIPDDVPMKSAERLDKALKLVLSVYEKRTGAIAGPELVAQFTEAIQKLHAQQEASGALSPELPG